MPKYFGATSVGAFLLFCVMSEAHSQATVTAPDSASFSLPSGDYKVPLPEGYCVPSGRYDAIAKIAAAADTSNLTDVSFDRCSDIAAGSNLRSWGMIKTPLATLKEKIPGRDEVLRELRLQVDPAAMAKISEQAAKDATPQVNTILGSDTKLGYDTKAVDSDQLAVYFTGTISISKGDGPPALVSVAYSITVANGAVFMIYMYDQYSGAADLLALVAKVKKETSDFVAANGG